MIYRKKQSARGSERRFKASIRKCVGQWRRAVNRDRLRRAASCPSGVDARTIRLQLKIRRRLRRVYGALTKGRGTP